MSTSISPRPRSRARPAASTAALVAAAASAGAGLVHAAAAGSHSGDTSLTWLFAVTAAAQLAWAAAAALRPHRIVFALGIVLNGGAAIAWALSRTEGLFGPLRAVEPVGTQDLGAAILAVLATVTAALAMARPSATRPANAVLAGLASALVLVLAVPAMAAEHTHGDSHDHAHTSDPVAAARGHVRVDDHDHAATGVDGTSTGPIISLDDSRLTKVQRRAATELLDSSRAALTRLPDEASVVAAGYHSIGDGRGVGSFEHFVNPAFVTDGRELDPDAIESIVLQRQADGTKTVASAMYILDPGKTMADVPEIAGELTTWHDHQNLCWDDTGLRLAGVLRDGVCVPGGTFRPTPPMIHVWLDDTPCGPFTGIEGHGGTCEHDHAA